ncbi:phage tail protein [Sphingomonas immobilis]|uniref:Fibronectin type-III domain-containing protein n=1 Tax=Sphingomonas immobilis TaxID=3063997 RepID=A0ABT9A0V5_9SPHN|nr:hypothetical protein [Sphingomonas sp. CA1-15]MDO7843461.1 hypothetical protein [Sphingomonas sp. CA1-15]
MKILKFVADIVVIAVGVVTGTLPLVLVGAAMLAGDVSGPKQSQGGSQTKWKADPYAGLPYVIGRTLVAGNIIYRRGHGQNNVYETFVTVQSIGQIQSIDTTFMNKTTTTFNGAGNANGTYSGLVYQRTQLGALPEASAFSPPIGSPPGWTSAHKLSGLAAVMNTFVYNSQDENGLTSEPSPSWIIHGVKVYDPRLDSTYPGGSGSCRARNEATYVYSEDPHLHGLTWIIGRWQNGKRVAGIGADLTSVDVAAYVEGANLNDARGWKVGGQVYTRPDTSWNTLKAILQAGAARPVMIGGMISCVNHAPRVSLATIGPGDIAGACTFSGTQPRRKRPNGIIPSYRSEEHDWEMVPADIVQVADYVALDGDERTKDVAYPLVQEVNQVAQLAAYDICDGREAGPGTVPLKPWWLNYRVGDCVTFAPEPGFSTKVLITGREINPQSGVVTYTLMTETDSKHPFALGLTGTPPPTASITYSTDVDPPPSADWNPVGATLTDNGVSIPAIVITGAVSNPSAEAAEFQFRVHGVSTWTNAGLEPPTVVRKEITGLTPLTLYDIRVRYSVRGVPGGWTEYPSIAAGAFSAGASRGAYRLIGQSIDYPLTSNDTTITIATFDGLLDDGTTIAFPAGSIGSLTGSTNYGVFWSISGSAYSVEADPALTSLADPDLVFLGWMVTSTGGTFPTAPTPPGGFGGNGTRPKNEFA